MLSEKIANNIIKEILSKQKKRNISESNFSSKNVITVDVQPEYESGITFDLYEWAEFINQISQSNHIIFLYNGAETLGMIDEHSYRFWLYELGIEEEVLDDAVFYDKGYAFFRYCMDSSIDEDKIVELVKFMGNNDITDSREIDAEMWDDFVANTTVDASDVRDLLEDADDLITIPDLMDFLRNYSNIVLMGGGINECLKEVEIALLALDKNYNTYSDFIY